MGLLGMDAVQEELTDKLLGDLVVQGSVAKVADNIYFGGDTLADLHLVFEEIVSRCQPPPKTIQDISQYQAGRHPWSSLEW